MLLGLENQEITILDDDVVVAPGEVQFTISNLEVIESDGQLSVSVTATDNIPEGVIVSVDYETIASTALAGEDFEVSVGTLSLQVNHLVKL